MQKSTLLHAAALHACLGVAKAALHLPAVRALLVRTAGVAALMVERGKPFDESMYPSLLITLRLAALAARQAPGAWRRACVTPVARAAVQLAVCAFQRCWEFAEKRLEGLAALPSEPVQRQLLTDLADGLQGAIAVLAGSMGHIEHSVSTDAPTIFSHLFTASEGAFQVSSRVEECHAGRCACFCEGREG